MPDQKAMLTQTFRLHVPSVSAGSGLVLENMEDNLAVRVKIGEAQTIVRTEDLATILSTILPPDRAGEIFGEIESQMVKKGKVMIQLLARKDIKKGQPIIASLDITKYIGSDGHARGVRTTKNGFIF